MACVGEWNMGVEYGSRSVEECGKDILQSIISVTGADYSAHPQIEGYSEGTRGMVGAY